MIDRLVIAIDGPSGVGKSTLGKALARRLGYLFIDSGAVYRAIGRKVLDAGVALDDRAGIVSLAHTADVRQAGDPDHLRVFLDGRDVTAEIRTAEASHASSVVATIPEVRTIVVDKLREMGRAGGVVMDGRDIGTKVFPDAPVKLFLEADPRIRAARRLEEDRQRGRSVSIEQVIAELQDRDRRDRDRDATPLVKAPDAILIDTSAMAVLEVVDRVLEIIRSRG